jgi:phosphoadenosine phosphosulfate reductase
VPDFHSLTFIIKKMNFDEVQTALTGKSIRESLSVLTAVFPGQVSFSSSLSHEDQVLTDLIFRNTLPVHIFTIDTGRLFNEVYELLQITEARYQQRLQIFFPDTVEVEGLVKQHGINCFYQNTDLRKSCCYIRKVLPLKRALKDVKVWVTGLRSGQSENRNMLKLLEWDPVHQLIKYNPLANWSMEQVLKYTDDFNVPVNPLYQKGFASIGCAPCTRAILPGEDARAGRWWWEESKKECGLHEPTINFQI